MIERGSINLYEKMSKEYDRLSVKGSAPSSVNIAQSIINQDQDINY